MADRNYYLRCAAGAAAAFVVGRGVLRMMDEEHQFTKGALKDAFAERKQRFAADGSTKNWVRSQFFMNKDGLGIFYRRWLPSPTVQPLPKAIVVISHGMGEHSGRYELLGSLLAQKGYAVYALDHQGHGQSEGSRMYVKWFIDYIADVHHLTELAKKNHPTLDKVFLLGHSMGALIAVHAVHEAPRLYSGVVLSAPPLKVDLPPGARKLLPTLSSMFPKMPSVPLDLATLCRDKSVVDRYYNDPLCNMGPNTTRLVSEVIKAVDKVPTFSSTITLPYLLMHGTVDKMCLFEGSKCFHETTSSTDKKFVPYEGSFHELYNEPDNMDNAIPETINWLESHL